MKNILSLNFEELRTFFLKSESYINVDLPPYIEFEKLLSEISKTMVWKSYRDVKKTIPDKLEDINYKLLHNKNGKYDWRPFELIHPVLYVSLVNQIAKYKNWKTIKKRFGAIRAKSVVECMSLPIVSESKKSDKAEQILNWWGQVEQKSLELSLEFSYIYHTDIANCYGSIYTHSIPWALHTKEIAKANNKRSLIGNFIDEHIRAMSYGQTNGIPQGSVLMDFIAEIVLNYADLLLSQKITKKFLISDFKIIRYRDDYRIFVNNPTIADEIIKELTTIMMELGLKLHAQKTVNFDNVIQGSVKSDKIDWMMSRRGATSIQKMLLILHNFSQDNANSGTVTKELQNIFNKIKKRTNKVKKLKTFVERENTLVLISIVVDIAYHNPRTYSISIAILSKLFSIINDEDEVKSIVVKLVKKFESIPNTGHMQIWLQRAIITLDIIDLEFNEKLCQLVSGIDIKLWNNDWLHPSITNIFDRHSIVNQDKIDNIDQVIGDDEVLLFGEQSL